MNTHETRDVRHTNSRGEENLSTRQAARELHSGITHMVLVQSETEGGVECPTGDDAEDAGPRRHKWQWLKPVRDGASMSPA